MQEEFDDMLEARAAAVRALREGGWTQNVKEFAEMRDKEQSDMVAWLREELRRSGIDESMLMGAMDAYSDGTVRCTECCGLNRCSQ